jgi:polar amino acid transport system substrate-binding protein
LYRAFIFKWEEKLIITLHRLLILLAFVLCLPIANTARAADIKIAFNSEWAPYSKGVAGKVNGILPDLIREILDTHMGMSVENVGYPWARVQQLVENGAVDAFITVPTAKRLQYSLTSSEVAYKVEMRTAVKRGSQAERLLSDSPIPATLKTLRYCDIRANGWGRAYAEKHSITPTIASKVISCLRMLDNQRVDVVLQSTVVVDQEMAAQNLKEKLIILPAVFGEMDFTLLLSKKSALGQDFIKRFDETVKRMKEDGSYDALISRLHSTS